MKKWVKQTFSIAAGCTALGVLVILLCYFGITSCFPPKPKGPPDFKDLSKWTVIFEDPYASPSRVEVKLNDEILRPDKLLFTYDRLRPGVTHLPKMTLLYEDGKSYYYVRYRTIEWEQPYTGDWQLSPDVAWQGLFRIVCEIQPTEGTEATIRGITRIRVLIK